jgi:hypothetical protein
MALLNLNMHYTFWYLAIIFPLSISQHQFCAVYFDFSMGVGLSPYAIPVHRLGLFWFSCDFVNRLRSCLSNWRLVNLISSALIFFQYCLVFYKDLSCDLWVLKYLLVSVIMMLLTSGTSFLFITYFFLFWTQLTIVLCCILIKIAGKVGGLLFSCNWTLVKPELLCYSRKI